MVVLIYLHGNESCFKKFFYLCKHHRPIFFRMVAILLRGVVILGNREHGLAVELFKGVGHGIVIFRLVFSPAYTAPIRGFKELFGLKTENLPLVLV